MPTPPTATGPGCPALGSRSAGSRQPQRCEQPRGGAPGESRPRSRGARARQPDSTAGSLELLRVRLPTSALGRPRPAEVRTPPALGREGEGGPQPQPGPFTLPKARTLSCACAARDRKQVGPDAGGAGNTNLLSPSLGRRVEAGFGLL